MHAEGAADPPIRLLLGFSGGLSPLQLVSIRRVLDALDGQGGGAVAALVVVQHARPEPVLLAGRGLVPPHLVDRLRQHLRREAMAPVSQAALPAEYLCRQQGLERCVWGLWHGMAAAVMMGGRVVLCVCGKYACASLSPRWTSVLSGKSAAAQAVHVSS